MFKLTYKGAELASWAIGCIHVVPVHELKTGKLLHHEVRIEGTCKMKENPLWIPAPPSEEADAC